MNLTGSLASSRARTSNAALPILKQRVNPTLFPSYFVVAATRHRRHRKPSLKWTNVSSACTINLNWFRETRSMKQVSCNRVLQCAPRLRRPRTFLFWQFIVSSTQYSSDFHELIFKSKKWILKLASLDLCSFSSDHCLTISLLVFSEK